MLTHDDGSMLSEIRQARSTRAPGFVMDEVCENETSEGPASEEAVELLEARVCNLRAREVLGLQLAQAIEQEDYAMAASLKSELERLES